MMELAQLVQLACRDENNFTTKKFGVRKKKRVDRLFGFLHLLVMPKIEQNRNNGALKYP